MSRFNVRAITEPVAAPVVVPHDKRPSAYNAMKHGGAGHAPPIISPTSGHVITEPVKRGRPSKEDLRRQKMDMASAAIATLLSDKPNRSKVRAYMEARIAQLNAEKR